MTLWFTHRRDPDGALWRWEYTPGGRLCTLVDPAVEGGRIAADHLITGCGYRYPAFISGARASRSNQDRLQGFRQRLAELDVPLPDERISFGAYSIESGYRSVEKLDRGGSEADCFFCGNDLIALGALQYLSEKDRPVPDRFGVVGFDDVYPWLC